MTTFEEKIKTAGSPAAAMLVLAAGIDAVLAELRSTATLAANDGWGSWDMTTGDQPATPVARSQTTMAVPPQRPVVDTSAIAAVETALQVETDPETRLALEARLRLLKEEGAALDTAPPAGVIAESVDQGDTVVTHLPTPNVERQTERARWARGTKLWEFTKLPETEFVEAFAKGGPLWLYHSGRDEVMAMPVEWRRAFVEDIHLDSPRTAQEVARDILKDEDPAGTRAVAEAHGHG